MLGEELCSPHGAGGADAVPSPPPQPEGRPRLGSCRAAAAAGTARDTHDSHHQPPRQHGEGLAGVIVFLSSGSRRGTLIFMKHYFTRICLREKESHFKGLQL